MAKSFSPFPFLRGFSPRFRFLSLSISCQSLAGFYCQFCGHLSDTGTCGPRATEPTAAPPQASPVFHAPFLFCILHSLQTISPPGPPDLISHSARSLAAPVPISWLLTVLGRAKLHPHPIIPGGDCAQLGKFPGDPDFKNGRPSVDSRAHALKGFTYHGGDIGLPEEATHTIEVDTTFHPHPSSHPLATPSLARPPK